MPRKAKQSAPAKTPRSNPGDYEKDHGREGFEQRAIAAARTPLPDHSPNPADLLRGPLPTHRAILGTAPAPVDPDPMLRVSNTEPLWHEGQFFMPGSSILMRLSETRRLGRLVKRA